MAIKGCEHFGRGTSLKFSAICCGSACEHLSKVRVQAEGLELVGELAVEGRDGVVTVGSGEGDDRGVGQAGESIGPELQHALPRTVLHAGELGDGVEDGSRLSGCQAVLALQDVHDLEDDGLRNDACDLAFFRGVEQCERGFLLRLVSLDKE